MCWSTKITRIGRKCRSRQARKHHTFRQTNRSRLSRDVYIISSFCCTSWWEVADPKPTFHRHTPDHTISRFLFAKMILCSHFEDGNSPCRLRPIAYQATIFALWRQYLRVANAPILTPARAFAIVLTRLNLSSAELTRCLGSGCVSDLCSVAPGGLNFLRRLIE